MRSNHSACPHLGCHAKSTGGCQIFHINTEEHVHVVGLSLLTSCMEEAMAVVLVMIVAWPLRVPKPPTCGQTGCGLRARDETRSDVLTAVRGWGAQASWRSRAPGGWPWRATPAWTAATWAATRAGASCCDARALCFGLRAKHCCRRCGQDAHALKLGAQHAAVGPAYDAAQSAG